MLVNKLIRTCLSVLLLLVASRLWSQADPSAAQSAEASDDRMVTPTPVSGVGLPLTVTTETPRKNYLRGGVNVESAYDSNALFQSTSTASHIYYSVSPWMMFSVTGKRAQWDISYKPGFRIYQVSPSLNNIDHDLGASLAYRLSPHVTFTLRESFIKTADLVTLPFESATEASSGVIEIPNNSVLAPVPDRLSNFGNVAITYQLGLNSMVGVKGTVSNLWYPNKTNASNFVFDSATQAGEGFYARRLSKRHYIGARYEFQKLVVFRSSETQTDSIVLFDTLYLHPKLSFSFFAGPQQADTRGGGAPRLHTLSPEAGASFGWQGSRTSFLASYSRRITDGGGLPSAVSSNRADASVLRLLAKRFTARLAADYATSSILNFSLPGSGGHTVSGGLSLQRSLGEHLGVDVGYTRLHQTYNSVPATISGVSGSHIWSPNADRVWVSLSYDVERALGR